MLICVDHRSLVPGPVLDLVLDLPPFLGPGPVLDLVPDLSRWGRQVLGVDLGITNNENMPKVRYRE